AIEAVHYGLAGLEIPCRDRGGITRLQHRSLRRDCRNCAEAACIHWNVLIDQSAETVEHASPRDRLWRIERISRLLARAGEVDDCFLRLAIDSDRDLDKVALVGLDREA